MRILIPIDFSIESAGLLKYAVALAREKSMHLSLVYCYSVRVYERKYDFKGEDYGLGIREMLKDFYVKNIDAGTENTRFLSRPGSKTAVMIQLSTNYSLILIYGNKSSSTWMRWLDDWASTFASDARCPVLIVPTETEYQTWSTIWHINRKDNEKEILNPWLGRLKIDLSSVQVKSLDQVTFTSPVWKSVVRYLEHPSKSLYENILKLNPSQKIQLIILVSHRKSTFAKFLGNESVQIILQFGVPVLICQAPHVE